MAESIEFKYITINKRGTPVLADTNTSIIPIGVAHEGGVSESELLEQYGIPRAQLHSALAYFYEHREEIRAHQRETEALLHEQATDAHEMLNKLKNR